VSWHPLARWTTTLELAPILTGAREAGYRPALPDALIASMLGDVENRMALGWAEPVHLVSLKALGEPGGVMLANLILALEEEPWWPAWQLDGLPEPRHDHVPGPTPEEQDGWRFFVQLPAKAWEVFHAGPPPPAPED
jgi:hypothetical protein